MKVFVLLTAVCGIVLGTPQVTTSGKYYNPEEQRFLERVLGYLNSTNQGVGSEGLRTCKFPFIWRGVTHSTCTTIDHPFGESWCSTKTDDENYHVPGANNFKHCTLDDGPMAADSLPDEDWCRYIDLEGCKDGVLEQCPITCGIAASQNQSYTTLRTTADGIQPADINPGAGIGAFGTQSVTTTANNQVGVMVPGGQNSPGNVGSLVALMGNSGGCSGAGCCTGPECLIYCNPANNHWCIPPKTCCWEWPPTCRFTCSDVFAISTTTTSQYIMTTYLPR